MSCNSFFAAGEAEVFFSCSLNINAGYVNIASVCNIFPHFANVLFEFRLLSDDSAININYLKTFFFKNSTNLFQKFDAVCIFVFFISVREQNANIAKRSRPQKRINNRMNQNISVRMAQKAKIMVYKGTVVHGQNDENVLEYHLWTKQWTDLLQASKFSQDKWPLAFELLNNCGGENHEGFIGMQDHGDDVWFRNIRVKVLD